MGLQRLSGFLREAHETKGALIGVILHQSPHGSLRHVKLLYQFVATMVMTMEDELSFFCVKSTQSNGRGILKNNQNRFQLRGAFCNILECVLFRAQVPARVLRLSLIARDVNQRYLGTHIEL